MAAYHTGKHAEALGVLRECQKARNPYSASTALVFEAMALHHLGQPGKARAALERADEMYRDLLASLADSPEGPLGRDWVDVLIFQIAREEAGRVMKLPVPDPR
jgi:tetratricopeptide (TPR) repeat protein